MNHAHSHKVGLTVGGTVALLHVAWSVLVFLGLGQSLMESSQRLHFVSMGATVLPFSFGTALSLVIVAGAIGYGAGYIAGELWSRVQRSSK